MTATSSPPRSDWGSEMVRTDTIRSSLGALGAAPCPGYEPLRDV